MALMRHTNLTTTTKYIRALQERMKELVAWVKPGVKRWGNFYALRWQKSAKNDSVRLIAELLKASLSREKLEGMFGGGGQIRTVDAADMSHADSDSNLLDLLTKILLEASGGDNRSG
jgi:hypothetical protein